MLKNGKMIGGENEGRKEKKEREMEKRKKGGREIVRNGEYFVFFLFQYFSK